MWSWKTEDFFFLFPPGKKRSGGSDDDDDDDDLEDLSGMSDDEGMDDDSGLYSSVFYQFSNLLQTKRNKKSMCYFGNIYFFKIVFIYWPGSTRWKSVGESSDR